MTGEQRILLPFPPSVNGTLRAVRGRVWKSRTYRSWIINAGWTLKSQNIKRYADRVDIEIILTPPDRRRRDADNYSKAITDLLKRHIIIQDDDCRWVRANGARWSDDPSAIPGAIVVIRPCIDSADPVKVATDEDAGSSSSLRTTAKL